MAMDLRTLLGYLQEKPESPADTIARLEQQIRILKTQLDDEQRETNAARRKAAQWYMLAMEKHPSMKRVAEIFRLGQELANEPLHAVEMEGAEGE